MNSINNQKYYQTLGIDKNATEADIKDAYTRLAEIFRPDKIKEKKGREALYIEKQAWNEILDAYSEALKEVDNKKEENENEQENGNDINVNLESFSKKSEEDEIKKVVSEDKNQNKNDNYDFEDKKRRKDEESKKCAERFKHFDEKIIEPFYQIRTNRNKKGGRWTRTSDIVYYYLKKRGIVTYPLVVNKVTKQLAKDIYPLNGCECRDDESMFAIHAGFFTVAEKHFHNCLKNSEEIEAFRQKLLENYTKILDETERVALADEESVREVDKIRKSGGCVACHQEQSKNGIDNQQITSTFNEKRESKSSENNNSSNQDNINTDKDTLIKKLKTETAELKKNLNPNDAKQKTLLAQKCAQLAELEGKNKQNQSQVSGDKNNKKENNLTSILLPIGIIFAFLLVVSSSLWIAKKRKSLRRIKKV